MYTADTVLLHAPGQMDLCSTVKGPNHCKCSELDQIQDFIHVNLNEFTKPNFTEALRDVLLVESDVSVLGLPSPLGVLRCLDDVHRGVLLVRSAAAPRVDSEGTSSSTWYSSGNLNIIFVQRGQ